MLLELELDVIIPIALNVAGPAIPSTVSPFFFFESILLLLVFVFHIFRLYFRYNIPIFFNFVCICVTSLPLDPYFDSASTLLFFDIIKNVAIIHAKK